MVAVAGAVTVIAGLAGCANNTPSAGPSSGSMGTSATSSASAAPGDTSGPSTAPGSTAPSALAGFLGLWHVHGAALDVTESEATIVVSLGPCDPGSPHTCSETDTLAPSVSADGTQLTLVVTAVSYTNDTAATVPNPNPGSSTAIGDSMQLIVQAPGLLKRTALNGFPGWQGGNGYWCGDGINDSDAALCGA